ncbi:MAG: MBL fold metallo-hydrolase [Desulfosalsimonadaceae bacterium]|nr:MBL fold metallo-hydrolase [Desulfosalsimonadaceae bacterium]
MQFGGYDCSTVVMDSFLLDGGAMFGVVPKKLWEKAIPADSENRIPLTSRSLVIRGRGRVILVDNGVGDKLPGRFKKIYGIAVSAHSMDERLAPLNLNVSDITDVILTHLHFDHAGGSTILAGGMVRPAFPNATYHVQKSQWDLACHPSLRDRSSYIPDNFLPLLEHNVLNLLDGPADDFFEGIHLIVTNGHTPGQQHPLILGSDRSLFFCADLIPTSAHLPVPWHMAYDNHPIDIMDEKAALLGRAVDENWILCFEHDPVTVAAGVRKDRQKVVMDQAVVL